MAFNDEAEVLQEDTEILQGEPDALEATDDIDLADKMRHGRKQILSEIRKMIIGQQEVVEQVLLSLFVGGNSLLIGVPGLAKTLLIKTVADVLDLNIGPQKKVGHEIMPWLVKGIQDVVDISLSLDTTNLAAIEAGLKVAKRQCIINSVSAEAKRLETVPLLAKEYDAIEISG